jgi:hypothetical protein
MGMLSGVSAAMKTMPFSASNIECMILSSSLGSGEGNDSLLEYPFGGNLSDHPLHFMPPPAILPANTFQLARRTLTKVTHVADSPCIAVAACRTLSRQLWRRDEFV